MNIHEKIVFFGTSRFAVIVFQELFKTDIAPALLVTQPDRPQGRRLELAPTPAKTWAIEHHVPVLTPEKLDARFIGEIDNGRYNLAIVSSYGTLLPKKILDLFTHGALNVHPSLLPKYRGASPVQSQILLNDHDTGVAIILLDEKMDHGPIIAFEHISIPNWPPNALHLEDVLAKAGGALLAHTIPSWLRGEITPHPQNDHEVTFTKKISKTDGEIKLENDPYQNFLKIQAFTPWPGTYFFVERNAKKIRVKVIKASYTERKLTIERVIPEGGREMAYSDFLRNS